MTRVTVGTGKSYDVLIGRGLLQDTGKFIRTAVNRCTAAVITDDRVDTLYGDCVCDSLKSAGFRVLRYVFPHGEASKSLSTYADILAFLAQNQVTRSDIRIALGGGVSGRGSLQQRDCSGLAPDSLFIRFLGSVGGTRNKTWQR